jgi:hypothetical protein
MWTMLLQCSLQFDPSKRSTMKDIRVKLDEDSRCTTPTNEGVDVEPMTMLEVRAIYISSDSANRYSDASKSRAF